MSQASDDHGAPVAIITGGGSGIGAASARRLSQEGFRIALFGRTPAKLEAVATELRDANASSVLVVSGAQEILEDVRACVERTVTAWGRIDILVNNAAIYEPGGAVDTSLDDWTRTLAVNLHGPLHFVQQVVPVMRRQSSGLIVNVSSTLGVRTVPYCAAYATSKAALNMLSRCVALEEARHGIRSVTICPGVVDTPIHDPTGAKSDAEKQTFLEEMGKFHPVGRVGTADEVAALVEFLAGKQAEWITGTELTIDGGVSLK